MRLGTFGPRIRRVLEVNVAVDNIDEAMVKFQTMGFADVEIWTIDHAPIQIRTTSFSIAGANLSLIAPLTSEDPVSRFLTKRGEGLFSVSLLVSGLEEIMDQWITAGVGFVRKEPMVMRDITIVGRRIPVMLENWTRPSTTHGVVIELQDHRDDDGNPYSPPDGYENSASDLE